MRLAGQSTPSKASKTQVARKTGHGSEPFTLKPGELASI